jgi:hypothetical protein
MRAVLAMALAVIPISLLAAVQPEVPRVHLESIPAEFMGRWVASRDQCNTGGESWLTIDRINLTSSEEWAFIASAWRIGADQLELDLTWRSGKGEPPKGRYTRRYIFSPDRRTITDAANGTVRVRCDD